MKSKVKKALKKPLTSLKHRTSTIFSKTLHVSSTSHAVAAATTAGSPYLAERTSLTLYTASTTSFVVVASVSCTSGPSTLDDSELRHHVTADDEPLTASKDSERPLSQDLSFRDIAAVLQKMRQQLDAFQDEVGALRALKEKGDTIYKDHIRVLTEKIIDLEARCPPEGGRPKSEVPSLAWIDSVESSMAQPLTPPHGHRPLSGYDPRERCLLSADKLLASGAFDSNESLPIFPRSISQVINSDELFPLSLAISTTMSIPRNTNSVPFPAVSPTASFFPRFSIPCFAEEEPVELPFHATERVYRLSIVTHIPRRYQIAGGIDTRALSLPAVLPSQAGSFALDMSSAEASVCDPDDQDDPQSSRSSSRSSQYIDEEEQSDDDVVEALDPEFMPTLTRTCSRTLSSTYSRVPSITVTDAELSPHIDVVSDFDTHDRIISSVYSFRDSASPVSDSDDFFALSSNLELARPYMKFVPDTSSSINSSPLRIALQRPMSRMSSPSPSPSPLKITLRRPAGMSLRNSTIEAASSVSSAGKITLQRPVGMSPRRREHAHHQQNFTRAVSPLPMRAAQRGVMLSAYDSNRAVEKPLPPLPPGKASWKLRSAAPSNPKVVISPPKRLSAKSKTGKENVTQARRWR
ncbi:hypothetical protein C8J56DRAFT_910684 [Mycena floridula]|nr:hypothetical protein C8J56DRAFT_910684 [Mycena floridula]